MTSEDFTWRWEAADMVRFDPDVVNQAVIPEEAKQHLIQIGLPRLAEISTVGSFHLAPFDPDPDRSAGEQQLAFSSYKYNDNNRFLLGHLQHGIGTSIWPFYIVEKSGIIKCRTFYQSDRDYFFVNSSIAQFAETLVIFDQYTHWSKKLPAAEDSFTKQYSDLHSLLEDCDPHIFQTRKSSSFWDIALAIVLANSV